MRRSAASGVSIGRDGGDVVVSTRRLDRVLEHEAGDLTAIVEAGIRIGDLNERLAEHGQMLALDPPGNPTIGACVAANLSGPRRHRYGTRARPRDRRDGRARGRDGRQLGRQGGQERRRLRPRQAVLRLGGATRADRAGCAPAAPCAGGEADAGRAGRVRRRCGGEGARDPARAGRAVGGRPALARPAGRAVRRRPRAGWRSRSRSPARQSAAAEDESVWAEAEERQIVVSRPPLVRSPGALVGSVRGARRGGRARIRREWPTCRRRSQTRATPRRSPWPSESGCSSTRPVCSRDGRHLARAARRLRPLRVLPADVPDVRAAVAGGDGLAARPHSPDGRARARERSSSRRPPCEHFDRCLGCMACVTSCPSGVATTG